MVAVDETDKLYEDTRGIYEAFSPLKVKPMRDLLCDRSAAAQALFSIAVQTGWETHGIELDEPAYKYVDFAGNKGRGSSTKLSDGEMSRSGSVHSMASVSSGSVREDCQQVAPPKLPPRSREEKQRLEIGTKCPL